MSLDQRLAANILGDITPLFVSLKLLVSFTCLYRWYRNDVTITSFGKSCLIIVSHRDQFLLKHTSLLGWSFMRAPTVKTFSESTRFFSFRGQIQFARSIRLFHSQMLNVHLKKVNALARVVVVLLDRDTVLF